MWGKLELQLCGELCGIIDKPMFLPSPTRNLHDDSLAKFISLVVQNNILNSLSNRQFF